MIPENEEIARSAGWEAPQRHGWMCSCWCLASAALILDICPIYIKITQIENITLYSTSSKISDRNAASWNSLSLSHTAVCVDDPGLLKTHSEVVQHGGLVQIAEGSEVILPDQDVRVAKRRQLGIGWVDGVEACLQASG